MVILFMPVYDLVIIDGTLSGLHAAWTSSRLHLKTLLVEEESFVGKHYALHHQKMIGHKHISQGMRGFEVIKRLEAKLRKQKNLEIKTQTKLLKMSSHSKKLTKLHLQQQGKKISVLAKVVLETSSLRDGIATGLRPRNDGMKFDQDDQKKMLPGVLPLLGAQLLLHRDRVLPGNRVAILGSSNLALCFGLDLVRSGIYNITFIEEKNKICGHHYYAHRLKRYGFYFYTGTTIQNILGNGKVQKIILKTKSGKKTSLDIDTLIYDDSSPIDSIEEATIEKTNTQIHKLAHDLNKISKQKLISLENASKKVIQKLNYENKNTKFTYLTNKTLDKDLICKHPGELICSLQITKNGYINMLLPWEFYPYPKTEEKILALDEKGKPLIYVPVISVEENKKHGVALVMIQAPKTISLKIKALQPPLGIYSFRNSVLQGENIHFGDVFLNKKKTRVHLNLPITTSLWEDGIRNLGYSKNHGFKKLFCNRGFCDLCKIRINNKIERACLTMIQKGTIIAI